MEEINIGDVFRYFTSKLHIILIITTLVLLLGMGYTMFIQKPDYKASTLVVLVGSSNKDESITSTSELSLNRQLVQTYSVIIKSRSIMETVINNLNLDMTPDELSEKVTLTTQNNTEVIKIQVTNGDPAKASSIANEIAKVFSNKIVTYYPTSTNIKVIDKAITPTTPYNINVVKQYITYFAAGLALSLLVVFVIYYFDNTVKTQEDIERLGLPVLGTIPIQKHKKKKEEGSR